MINIKERIQEIKLARMGPEYRFVSELFSDLKTCTSRTKPDHIYFIKKDTPIMVYDKKANYLWCHYDIIWSPLENLVYTKIRENISTSFNKLTINEMRIILSHFALAYYDISNATISMAHSYITETWKTLKFRRVYVW